MSDDSLVSVLAALAANLVIAVAKGIAAALTGSAALFAETLHTLADAGNEVLLWIAVRRSARPADPTHPLGYGPERYYWALLAAAGMFVVGGVVAIYQGVRALLDPPALDSFWVGVTVLVIALVLDGSSRVVAVRTLRARPPRVRRRCARCCARAPIRRSRRSTSRTRSTCSAPRSRSRRWSCTATLGWEWPDAVASLIIGGLLTFVAWRMGNRNRGLLSNQAVAPQLAERLRARLEREPGIAEVVRMESVYLGPREAMVAADVVVDCSDVEATLARVAGRREGRRRPFVKRLYLTPGPKPARRGPGVAELRSLSRRHEPPRG